MNANTLHAVAGKRYTVRQKLLLGAGQSVEASVSLVAATFLLFYLTSVCGLDPAVAGGILFASLVVDAVADPLIGALSDRWRSRWGRRLPFMVVALPLVGLASLALFAIPLSFGATATAALALAANIVLRLSTSLYALPYAALTAELTTDYAERSSIAVYRALFNFLGAVACMAPAFTLIFGGTERMSDPAAYRQLGMLLAGVSIFSGLVCLAGIRKMAPAPAAVVLAPRPRALLRDLGEIARNRSFVVLFMACLIGLVVAGSLQALNLYAFKYYWHLPAAQAQTPVLILQAGFLLGIPLAALLFQKLEKRTALTLAFVALAVAQGVIPLLVQLPLLAGTPPVVTLSIMNAVFGLSSATVFIGMQSMVADAIDEHDLRFGTRCEGLYYSSVVFATKAAVGIGSLLAGLTLSLVGLSGAQAGAAGATLSAGSAHLLGMLWGPGHAILILLAVPFLMTYRIDRREHARIIAALAQRVTATPP